MKLDIGIETEAYAFYLNAPRDHFRHEELVQFEADMDKAQAQMERAWLEASIELAS